VVRNSHLKPITEYLTVNTNQGEMKMYLSGYSVRIPKGREDSQAYVRVKHGKHYKVVLSNKNNTRCYVNLSIDGKEQGTWIINPHSTIELERPSYDNGKFTFYELGSKEARKGGLQNNHDLGLITAVFTPEKKTITPLPFFPISWEPTTYPQWPQPSLSNIKIRSIQSTCDYTELNNTSGSCGSVNLTKCAEETSVFTNSVAGGTALAGHSDQEFITVNGFALNHDKAVTINLRLIADKDQKKIRPLGRISNPIPPRLK
jgi:hypothetical protein